MVGYKYTCIFGFDKYKYCIYIYISIYKVDNIFD